jgi:hypothetical protein
MSEPSSPDTRLLREAVHIIGSVQVGTLGLAAGCRELVRLSHRLDLHEDPLFLVAIAVDSETDSYPIGPERELWLPASLTRKDMELAAYESLISERALAELEELRAHLEQLLDSRVGGRGSVGG